MQFTDTAPVTGTRRSAEGYLIAEACAVRTGVQIYAGADVRDARPVVRVWRPEAEVRAADSLRSFSHAPVTVGHPTDGVTAETWKALAVGEVSTDAEWVGNRIRLPLILKDAAAIRLVEAGTRELSAGYTCDLAFEDGVTPEGEAYDAVQRNIRINHLAIVPRGRAGSECRIGDDAGVWGAAPITQSDNREDHMSDALKTVVLGDKAVSVAAADAATIDAWKADQARALSDAAAGHDKALAIKDAALAAKDAEIADLKGKILSDADMDKRVEARSGLVRKATALVKDYAAAGKADATIRREIVTAKRGATMTDKSDAYIEAAFDLLADAAPDPVRGAVPTADAGRAIDEDAAYRASVADMNAKPKKGA